MGFLEVSHLAYALPDGRVLLDDVSFRVGEGDKVALVGANGAGKTTLVRLIAGDEQARAGTVSVGGGLGVMRQFIGQLGSDTTVRDLLVALSPGPVQQAARKLLAAEEALAASADHRNGVRYANAVATWGDVGGYHAEVLWDVCTSEALGRPFTTVAARPLTTLSGGEQKRLALEALLRGDAAVLLLDEPDNFLDLAAKRWLAGQLQATPKTVLFVSHDRELLSTTATAVVTIEGGGPSSAWMHHGGFATWAEARQQRLARLDEQHRRWREERQRLVESMREFKRRAKLSDKFASRAQAAETKLRRFEAAGSPPTQPRDQKVDMRLVGGRTGVRAVAFDEMAIPDLVQPFTTEVLFGERVAVVGRNGAGKSHLLRLLAGHEVAHQGSVRLGARVVPGWFSQAHDVVSDHSRTLLELLWREGIDRAGAMRRLRRYELQAASEQPFGTLSGGQQARFQILLLEIAGATLLLLDEPTDNLDLVSAQALEDGLEEFEGTVIAVTHDRWFMRSFDRFLVVDDDGRVTEAAEVVEPAAG